MEHLSKRAERTDLEGKWIAQGKEIVTNQPKIIIFYF